MIFYRLYIAIFITIIGHNGFCSEAPHLSPFSNMQEDMGVHILSFLDPAGRRALRIASKKTKARTDKFAVAWVDKFFSKTLQKPFHFLSEYEEDILREQLRKVAPLWNEGQAFPKALAKEFISALPTLDIGILVVKETSFLERFLNSFKTDSSTSRDRLIKLEKNKLFEEGSIVQKYATKGVSFWNHQSVGSFVGKPNDLSSSVKKKLEIDLQRVMKARYVYASALQEGGTLPDATGDEAVLNELTPHVVVTSREMQTDPAIKAKMDAFFKSKNTEARGTTIPDRSDEELYENRQIRLVAERNANAVAVIDVIPSSTGELMLGRGEVPLSIRKLIVTSTSDTATRIRNEFLSSYKDLTDVTFKDLENVTSIGDYFLMGCTGILYLELQFNNLNSIGAGFLWQCSHLKTLDLLFPNLTSIGEKFLIFCNSLRRLELQFPNLTSIGDDFLAYCNGLPYLDLSSLINLRTIGDDYFRGCDELRSLIAEIENHGGFIAYIRSLQHRAEVPAIKTDAASPAEAFSSVSRAPALALGEVGALRASVLPAAVPSTMAETAHDEDIAASLEAEANGHLVTHQPGDGWTQIPSLSEDTLARRSEIERQNEDYRRAESRDARIAAGGGEKSDYEEPQVRGETVTTPSASPRAAETPEERRQKLAAAADRRTAAPPYPAQSYTSSHF